MCLCLALLRSALSLRAMLTQAAPECEGTVQNSSPSCVAIPVPCSGNFPSPQKCPSRTLAIITPNSYPPAPDNQEPTVCVCGLACSGRFPSAESHPGCPSVSAPLTERHVLVHVVVSVRASLLFMAEECFRLWRDLFCCISEQNVLTLKLLNVSSHILQILL